ncbi:PadR family transcriptional regulator [Arthrobacter sp. Sa2CUA1]|uniref:PadR family transcriptional regulator n=2 Tax=Arthrobacter TaxID=1663 RepID=A0ABR8UPV3_9MICC|nr:MULTISPECIES: PadR family transcriptional regulator [Arthrobacter]MBD7994558.1 PadR family transcriptional regulator [Arthrobacter gallicola]MBD8042734.1 PadR family transcriptional regulator [Arthrobacter pullicola]
MDDELLGGHLQELRRGTVVLACLSILKRPGYGYGLLEALDKAGFAVEANTLYPLLRRLEKQGLLTSSWDTGEARPRKFYTTSEQGRELLEALLRDWDSLHGSIRQLNEGRQS